MPIMSLIEDQVTSVRHKHPTLAHNHLNHTKRQQQRPLSPHVHQMPKRAGRRNRNALIRHAIAKSAASRPPDTKKKTITRKKKPSPEKQNKEPPAPTAVAADAVGDVTSSQEKSSDVAEGKTIFIRNLSYNTEEEDITDLVIRFGELEYCVICRDKETGQSRGSAFVKFRDAASAESCVAADSSELVLDGRSLNIDFALDRNQVQKKTSVKTSKDRDKRNLYLQHEGWIRAGTDAAVGVSTSDLQKRATLADRKKQALQILTNFVSKTRLCIHNLPPDMDDKKLRALFLEAGGPAATITEARVMRNKLKNGKLSGSKGFAFVNFTHHENALLALRKLNNNPDVFSNTKRPIVEFSIENMFALKKKERIAAKSAEAKTEVKDDESKVKVKEIAKKMGVAPRIVQKNIKMGDKKKKTKGRKKKSGKK